MLAAQLGCQVADIVDFELNVCDTQPGTLGGTWCSYNCLVMNEYLPTPGDETSVFCQLTLHTCGMLHVLAGWQTRLKADVNSSRPTGPEEEFVLVGRLDNLAMSFCCTKALADACRAPDALSQERGVRAIALFDHEECGSGSAQGRHGQRVS